MDDDDDTNFLLLDILQRSIDDFPLKMYHRLMQFSRAHLTRFLESYLSLYTVQP